MADISGASSGDARHAQVSAGGRLKAALGWIYAPALAHRRALAVMNLLYFGAFFVALFYVAIDPSTQKVILEAAGAAFSPTGPLSSVTEAYLSGQLLSAIALTFVVNLVVGSFLYITLPSLIPFLGILVGVFRAVLWGLLFSPFSGVYDATILPHTLVMLLEGEGYILAMLGVWLWWKPVFSRRGQRGRMWVEGVKAQGRVYVAVALTLAISAVYEAVEVIFLIGHA